ncbi:MAG: hypothetical protein ABMA26_11815 [Limisphaerales bacterium]
MSTEPPLTEEALAKKCNWWWRESFAKPSQKKTTDMVSLLQSLKGSAIGKYLAAVTQGAVDLVHPSDTARTADIGNPSQQAQGTISAVFEAQCVCSAWHYEVAARLKGKYEFGEPWIKLSLKRKARLAKRWPDPVVASSRGCVRISIEEDFLPQQPGWTPPLNMSWNLRLNNKPLARGFLKMINQMRIDQGVPNPHPNAGIRRRAWGWRDVELMDIQKHGLRPLDESETSRLSKAKRKLSKAKAANRDRKTNT